MYSRSRRTSAERRRVTRTIAYSACSCGPEDAAPPKCWISTIPSIFGAIDYSMRLVVWRALPPPFNVRAHRVVALAEFLFLAAPPDHFAAVFVAGEHSGEHEQEI